MIQAFSCPDTAVGRWSLYPSVRIVALILFARIAMKLILKASCGLAFVLNAGAATVTNALST